MQPAAAQMRETKYSRFGEIVIVSNNYARSTISVDGRVIYSSEGANLSVDQIVQTRNRDYLVVAEGSGGNAVGPLLSLVAIGPGGFVRNYGELSLSYEGGKLQYEERDGAIWFTLDSDGVTSQVARIADDHLTILRQRRNTVRGMPPDVCQWLFTQVLTECVDHGRPGARCYGTVDNLSRASDTSNLQTRYPIFPVRRFAALCDAVCSAGRVNIQYRDFSRQICGG